jgi:hypothetical protein
VDEYDWLAPSAAGVEYVDAVQVYSHCRWAKASALLKGYPLVGVRETTTVSQCERLRLPLVRSSYSVNCSVHFPPGRMTFG